MGGITENNGGSKKKERQSVRPMTVALYILRCKQVGFTLDELEDLTMGMVFDILAERMNDNYEWDEEATSDDIDSF